MLNQSITLFTNSTVTQVNKEIWQAARTGSALAQQSWPP